VQISSLSDRPKDQRPILGNPSETPSLILRERRARAAGISLPQREEQSALSSPPPAPCLPLRSPGPLIIDLYRRDLAGKKCRRVTKADGDEALRLIQEMIAFCRVHDGAGLAAPQVGVYLQLAIALVAPKTVEILVNPEIVNLGGRELLEYEGCLSLPPYESPHGRGPVRGDPELPNPLNQARVWRSEIAQVRCGTLEDPEAGRVKVYKGWPARLVQHEIDHLQGRFFIDRLKPVARGLVLRRYEKFLKEQ
jgi:peptide deformylase